MNSHWKENLIIFEMALVPTRFEGHIKIKVLVPSKVNVGSNLVKVDKNLQGLQFDVKARKMLFREDLDLI